MILYEEVKEEREREREREICNVRENVTHKGTLSSSRL